MSFSSTQLEEAKNAAQKALQAAISVPHGEESISAAVAEKLFPLPHMRTDKITTTVTWHNDATWRRAHIRYPGGEFGVSLS